MAHSIPNHLYYGTVKSRVSAFLCRWSHWSNISC